MAHDVFISYASADQTVAQMVCATLETQGIRCWMAPRDVQPGDEWGGAIVAAIKASRVMVLVFSGAANDSRHIPREIERAVDREIPVVPVRIENVEPRGSLEYSLSSVHWLDAISPPVEAHIVKLADRLRTMIQQPAETGSAPPPPLAMHPKDPRGEAPLPAPPVIRTAPASAPKASSRGLIVGVVAIAGVVVIAGVFMLANALSNRPSAPATTSAGSSPAPTTSAAPVFTPPPTPLGMPSLTPTATPAPTPIRTPPPAPMSAPPETLHLNRGVAWTAFPAHKMGAVDPRRAAEYASEADRHPDDERPALDLAVIYYDSRRYNEAIAWFTYALRRKPGHLAARIDLAMSYWAVDRNTEAQAHLRRVLDNEPTHAVALLNIGVVYALDGKLSAAAEAWRRVIQHQPGTTDAVRARQMLDAIGAR